MNRAEEIVSILGKFADNYDLFSKLNDELLVDCDAKEWQELLFRRSEAQRRILSENEEILKRSKELMKEPIVSKEEADEILVFYRTMVNQRVSDYAILSILYEPLSTFYESISDYYSLIGLNVTASAVTSDIFSSTDVSLGAWDPLKCALKAIEYSKIVSPKENTKKWIPVFSAYANLMGSLTSSYKEIYKDFFKYYDEALSYFEDPETSECIMAEKNGPLFKTMLRGRFMYGQECYKDMSDEDKKRYHDLIISERDNPTTEYTGAEMMRLKCYLSCLVGEIGAREAFFAMKDYYEAHMDEETDCSSNDSRITTLDIMDKFFLISSMTDHLFDDAFSEDEKEKYAIEIANTVWKIVQSVPYNYLTSYVNQCCASIAQNLLSLIRNQEEGKKIIIDLLIIRQPITYIHSLMVREIALRIGKEMFDKRPELFVPLFGANAEEVKENKEAVRFYISKASILHDLGKTIVAEFINNQYRRIVDAEFAGIKMHSNLGPKVTMNSPRLEDYYDIMRGHHKFYNGKGGYPEDFDNVNSKYKIMIDLITIADCTDAATDILGRNYAKGKGFAELFEELKIEKGTRYNPDIIDLIEESPELIDELTKITGEDRKHIYYKAYRDVMHLNK